MTPEERKRLYVGKVRLHAVVAGPDEQDGSEVGYQVAVERNDGLPLSEMELRSVLANLSLAIDGDESLVDLERD
jgi:formylmethanofuran dehydrogenase subunit B